jgi:hypothetical protein
VALSKPVGGIGLQEKMVTVALWGVFQRQWLREKAQNNRSSVESRWYEKTNRKLKETLKQ